MEAIEQLETTPQFEISHNYFEKTMDAECPFCFHILVQRTPQTVSCLNAACPYTTEPVVREVVAALIDLGHDRLRAAQIAAEYTADLDDDTDPVSPAKFAVTDESSANWVLRKLTDIQTRRGAAQAMLDNEIEAMHRRFAKILGPLDRQENFFRSAFGAQLAEWTRKSVEGQKKRSVTLLHGSVGYRKNPDKLVIDDEDAAITLAEDQGLTDLVRVKKEIAKTVLRKWMEGEGIDSWGTAHIEPGEDTFYIKPEAL